jgi:hypothetical protein
MPRNQEPDREDKPDKPEDSPQILDPTDPEESVDGSGPGPSGDPQKKTPGSWDYPDLS